MNHAKIAAALHALAEAFEGAVDDVEQAVTGKKSGKKSAAAAPSATQSIAAPAAAAAVATTAVTAPVVAEEPVIDESPPAPPAPSVTITQVNAAVLKVAAKNRDAAVAILGKFGLTNTVGLAPEKFQALYDAFEEEIAKLDAAAVQVAQASLV